MPPKSKVIPKLRRGTLSVFGYRLHESAPARRRALDMAVREYGPGVVIHKLNAIRVLNKNRDPRASAVYNGDMMYIQHKYGH